MSMTTPSPPHDTPRRRKPSDPEGWALDSLDAAVAPLGSGAAAA